MLAVRMQVFVTSNRVCLAYFMMNRLTPLFLGFFACLPLALAEQGRPNILFLLSDDHSYPYVGCYGSKDVRTPALDQLAAEGMRFDRMYVSSPQCVPSRSALMTGRSAVANRMGRFTAPLPEDIPALPDLLRDKGYFTGVTGRSYHLDGVAASRGKGGADSVVGEILDRLQLRTFQKRADLVHVAKGGVKDAKLLLEDFLAKVPETKPWFLWLNFTSPHHPWNETGAEPLPADHAVTVPGFLPATAGVRADLTAYCQEVEHLDGQVAAVLELLKQRGLQEKTLVIFAGDNGMAFPHGKGYLYEPGIHVPLIVRWPGVLKPGGSSTALISGEDLAPTVLEVAGVRQEKSSMSGRSFAPLLCGKGYTPRQHLFAQRVIHGGDGCMKEGVTAAHFDLSRCALSDRYKLIYNCTPTHAILPVDSAGDSSWRSMVKARDEGKLKPVFVQAYFTLPRPIFELYDLEKDPHELTNLAGQPEHEAVEMELKRALTEKMVMDWDYIPAPLK
jgi:N-sulfoglucosamine sulfohydrolase